MRSRFFFLPLVLLVGATMLPGVAAAAVGTARWSMEGTAGSLIGDASVSIDLAAGHDLSATVSDSTLRVRGVTPEGAFRLSVSTPGPLNGESRAVSADGPFEGPHVPLLKLCTARGSCMLGGDFQISALDVGIDGSTVTELALVFESQVAGCCEYPDIRGFVAIDTETDVSVPGDGQLRTAASLDTLMPAVGAVRTTLTEPRSGGGTRIDFSFIPPDSDPTTTTRVRVVQGQVGAPSPWASKVDKAYVTTAIQSAEGAGHVVLDNPRAYYTLSVFNSSADGRWSEPLTRTFSPTTLTNRPIGRIQYGDRVRISGSLFSSEMPLSNALVQVHPTRRSDEVIARGRTDDAGKYTLDLGTARRSSYPLLVFSGNRTFLGSDLRISLPVQRKVKAGLSDRRSTVDVPVWIRGECFPKQRTKVVLTRRNDRGNWVAFATGQTTRKGVFRVPLVANRPGSYDLRVFALGDARLETGWSRTLRWNVRR